MSFWKLDFKDIISPITSLAAGFMGRASQDEAQEKNLKMQKEFAQSGIKWRVEDAKRAGIHPMYALGASTHSFSPTFVGDDPLANALSNAGSDIGRSLNATRTVGEREEKMMNLKIENQELQNDLLRSEIARNGPSQVGPGLPSGLPGVEDVSLKRTVSPRGRPFQEVGNVSDVGFAQTPTGLAPIPSKDVKERIEDQMVPELMWAVRNNLLPTYGAGNKPGLEMLPKGANDWRWSPLQQEWQPHFPRRWQEGDTAPMDAKFPRARGNKF